MEVVILVGIQAAGKSTFYKERFFAIHVAYTAWLEQLIGGIETHHGAH